MSQIKTILPRWIRPFPWPLALLLLGADPGLALDGAEPLAWGAKPVSSHAPYLSRECLGCHVKPWGGALVESGDNLCLPCHEDARSHVHAPKNCTRCHNAHDSMRRKLLRADLDRCGECHRKG